MYKPSTYTQLSKSEYMMFLKHPAWLWLKKHDKSKLPPIDANTQAMFDAGFEFETYAEQLFPEGKRIGKDTPELTGYNAYLAQPARTLEAIKNGTKTIFQGRFESNNLTCICDVITFIDSKTLDLFEIKSSTSAKIDHEYDLAFQVAVLEGCGYTVRNIKVLCVNNEYIKQGPIDPKQLVLEQDVTEAVKGRSEETRKNISKALEVVAAYTIPNISPSLVGLKALDEWMEIYKNLTKIPEGSIYELCRLNIPLLQTLEKLEITKLVDIPEDIELKPQQLVQIKANKEDKVFIDHEKIREFLNSFVFPLYFLDYETLASTIPLFDGQKPYQQIPFQYSLHIVESPNAAPKHMGYLHNDNSNPVVPLTESLKTHIGPTGTILVWNQSFEKGKNSEMGISHSQYFDFYEQINSRIVDLMVPFASGWYVHKKFYGSASIKKVLPVLIPELSYANLDIHEGGTAQRMWMETVLFGKHEDARAKVLSDLEKYCELDTLAMVKIYLELFKISF